MSEYRTKTGRVITDREIERWAAEAERGYDISRLIPSEEMSKAFADWWPAHAVRHNSRSPAAARDAFEAGWSAARKAIRQAVESHEPEGGTQWYIDENSIDVDAREFWRVAGCADDAAVMQPTEHDPTRHRVVTWCRAG